MKLKLFFTTVVFLVVSLTATAEVNVYSARKEALIKPLLERFEQETGIEVNLVTGDADALIKRLEIEGINSPADMLLTVDVARLYRAKEKGLLQPVDSDELNNIIPGTYRDDEGFWYGLSLRSRVIVYSESRVSGSELSTYESLADDKWHGRLCVRSSSNVYNQSLVASLVARHGVEATENWANELVDNFARPPRGGDRDQIKAVAAGQCDVALVNTYYLGGMLQSDIGDERNAAEKVRLFWPNQEGHGAHINISGAGVTSSAKHKNDAVRLLEFLVNESSQSWYANQNMEYPVRADVPVNDTLSQWGEFKADELNLDLLGEYNAEAVRLMDRAGWK